MKIEIKCRFDAKVLFECEAESLKTAVEAAVKAKGDLSDANLRGAKNIISFTAERHFAFAWKNKDGELQIKIGCECNSAADWLKDYESMGKYNSYSEREIRSYGAFIKLAIEHFAEEQK